MPNLQPPDSRRVTKVRKLPTGDWGARGRNGFFTPVQLKLIVEPGYINLGIESASPGRTPPLLLSCNNPGAFVQFLKQINDLILKSRVELFYPDPPEPLDRPRGFRVISTTPDE